jgi:hypothetical protein
VDQETRRYYERRAREIGRAFDAVESPLRRYFGAAFPEGGRVLDVGAATGREMATLVREGYQAWGVEPVEEFRSIAVEKHPEIAGRLVGGALPDALPSAEELGGRFDGVICCAVLQHVPRRQLFDAAYALRELLVEGGRLLASIPAARPGIENERDDGGRLFTGVTADELELLLERLGFARVGRWHGEDAQGRPGHRWVTLCMELRTSGEARPIDLLESVLSTRERKVATYKLALIRALCSIALTAPHSVTFGVDGRVRVPLAAIAERWIEYYWPLFEAETFLPQMNGEESKRAHLLAFSGELSELQERFRASGGLSAFVLARRSGTLTPDAKDAHRGLLRKLQRTIVAGPVTYAGGSLESRLFEHRRGQVLVDAALWRELSLTGHWVQEALQLRWAELVSQLSNGRVRVGDVLNHLCVDPLPERDTRAVRLVYERKEPLRCVWTDASIRRRELAIDHVLPFSLWRNNDLWNLLPTRASVNAGKSDDLPERGFLRRRRDAVVECWEATREAYPERFSSEARALTGARRWDVGVLFDVLVESVEVTALQRACRRWVP